MQISNKGLEPRLCQEILQLNKKMKNPMGERLELEFLQIRYTNDQEAHKNMLNII